MKLEDIMKSKETTWPGKINRKEAEFTAPKNQAPEQEKNHCSDYVFVAKAYGGNNGDRVKEEIHTSRIETLEKFIDGNTDHIGLTFYSNGDFVKSLPYQAELDKEDILLLLKSWISRLENESLKNDRL
ncbi:hypothetical protein [Candidatus Enterococcus clewellii]|uniref:Uncharacterized protein n=1 Tax=Candidatus Enterococcus clewellii TaxID=1834193 RepID=A0A242KAX2_9ENTE|nr:hypothetical protein [Enterococcus sp. 9E7_DIV0242]OTP17690.1 hypothetical protein A5888_001828 [Enterococcus sp. 9E7_DIV0242]